MAKLRIYQSLDSSDYVFNFVSENSEVSQADKDLMDKFGEPEINIGGTFTEGEGLLTFELPDEYVKVVSGFPVKKIFTPTAEPWDDTDVEDKMDLYRTTIQTRFSTAFTTLRANQDTFTNEYVTNV
jgi:hypothetical protein